MFVYIIRFVDTLTHFKKHVHIACDVMKERTLYLLKPSSLIWHLMPYLFLLTQGMIENSPKSKPMPVNQFEVHSMLNDIKRSHCEFVSCFAFANLSLFKFIAYF